MAFGCLIRARWRSGRSNHGVESGVGFAAQRLLVPAQRVAYQPRRPNRSELPSPHDSTKNRHDLARRNGVGWMRWLGGTTPEGRDDLPDVLAPEGAPRDGVRGRSASAQLDATTVGCVPRDGARGHCPRFRSHQDGGRMRALGCGSKAFPAMTCPGTGCLPRDGGRMPDSRALAIRPRQSRG
jgi:hypothetical protein